jgi:phytoene synthase
MSELSDSYARCEAITREQAANFYYGIRLLAPERRRALCAAYAFARRVDDIGDGELPHERKLELLRQADVELGELAGAGPTGPGRAVGPGRASAPGGDPVMVALADACARFGIPVGALSELVEGVRMDVLETRYETFEELVGYCRRVAGAIGRVCLSIFGSRAPANGAVPAETLADDLGVALQLTNILRDVREDAENGRVYLPGEDLRRFGLPDRDPLAEPDKLSTLVRFEAERAQAWFERGMELVPLLDRRSAACVRAMAGIYHRLLERIESDPERVLRERVSLSAREKAWVAARALAGAAS